MKIDRFIRLSFVIALAAMLAGAPLCGQTFDRSDNAEARKTLYLHWIKPRYRSDGSAPMHLLTLRVTPSVAFDVSFRDPAFKSREIRIKGAHR